MNGNFASGSLSPGWINESTTQGNDVSVTTAQSYQSTYSAFMGSLGPPEINGWASIAQQVKVPTGGVLSFWVYQGSNEGALGYGTRYAWNAGLPAQLARLDSHHVLQNRQQHERVGELPS